MKRLESMLIKVEGWIQEELAAQDAMLELLGRQEAAVREGDTETFRGLVAEVERAIASGEARARRRDRILADLAQHWGVSPRTLSLRSIVARVAGEGREATRLEGLRARLRERTATVLQTGRRIAAHARYRRGFLEELVAVLIERPDGIGEREDGVLLDAEA